MQESLVRMNGQKHIAFSSDANRLPLVHNHELSVTLLSFRGHHGLFSALVGIDRTSVSLVCLLACDIDVHSATHSASRHASFPKAAAPAFLLAF